MAIPKLGVDYLEELTEEEAESILSMIENSIKFMQAEAWVVANRKQIIKLARSLEGGSAKDLGGRK